ncbi:hypothetical protein L1049_016435 [Liquidambar formosana]|uniref:RNase H type-1 domain-containing protein n=1 Tax=Liquidambar formosana TaxID=63359 RepID=A0AAP0S6D2_LIQFO
MGCLASVKTGFTRCKSIWEQLPSGFIKINVDVAVGSKSSYAACIARDEHDFVLGAWATIHPMIDPVIAEAYATRLACLFARDKGWSSVCFEGDAQVIINGILSPSLSSAWSYDVVILDIKFIANTLRAFSFKKASTEANVATHEMARWGGGGGGWFFGFPR